jgi:hypothetical protein
MAEKRALKECKAGASSQAENSKKNSNLRKIGKLAWRLHCTRQPRQDRRGSEPEARRGVAQSTAGTQHAVQQRVREQTPLPSARTRYLTTKKSFWQQCCFQTTEPVILAGSLAWELAMSRSFSVLPPFSFSAMHAPLVALFGGKPREVDDHIAKKTGDRAPNREHCRAVCVVSLDLWQQDRGRFLAYLADSDVPSPHRLIMAGTGRPTKDRRSGKNAGQQEWADRLATQILTDLCFLAGVERPDVTYAGQRGAEWSKPSPQALKFAPATDAPATVPAKGKGKAKVS